MSDRTSMAAGLRIFLAGGAWELDDEQLKRIGDLAREVVSSRGKSERAAWLVNLLGAEWAERWEARKIHAFGSRPCFTIQAKGWRKRHLLSFASPCDPLGSTEFVSLSTECRRGVTLAADEARSVVIGQHGLQVSCWGCRR